MEIKEAIEHLNSKEAFKEWKEKNSHCFLAHIFLMFDKLNKNTYQIGYYNPQTDKMTTFVLEEEKVSISAESEIFKKPEATIEVLDIDKVKITLDQCINLMKEFHAKEYASYSPLSAFVIVQTVQGKPAFNFTYVTQAFKTLNVKFDAQTGEVFEHSLKDLIEQAQ